MPTFTKAYIGSTPLFKEQGFAYIEGADAGGGVQSLTNEFKHNTGTLTIFGNVTSTKDFHLCEGSSAIPANCVISGTSTQTNAGPQGSSSSQRGFTIAQSATNVGTLTISGNVTLYSGMFIGDNRSTASNGTLVLNSGQLVTNGSMWLASPTATVICNGGTHTITQLFVSGGGHATDNPNPVSVVTMNGGVLNINYAAAVSQSNILFGVSSAGISSTSTINLNGGTLKHNQITSNVPASGRTIVNTINFNGGVLDLDKGASRNLPNATGTGLTWNLVIKNGGAIISVYTGATMTMAVAFSNDGTNGGLTKQGPGTLAMGSLAHSYNGATSISEGVVTRVVTNEGTSPGTITGTATFTTTGSTTTLSVSFSATPSAGMKFKFFPGVTTQTISSITLSGVSGRTGSYASNTGLSSTSSVLTIS